MGLFSKLLGGDRKETVLCAPVKGVMKDITLVSDSTFSDKLLGDGIAITPSEGRIISPCDGEIDNMFETGHAFSIVSEDGAEILVHAGFDTVELKGEGFKVHKNTGEKVKKGDVLVEADLDLIGSKGYDTTIVMVILNTDEYSGFEKKEGEVEAGDPVLKMTRK